MLQPTNLNGLVSQSVDASYHDRNTVAIAADWQRVTLTGEMPFVTRHIVNANTSIKSLDAFVPEGFEVTRRHIFGTDATSEIVLAVKPGLNLLIERNGHQVDISVASTSMEKARHVLNQVVDTVPAASPVPPNVIDAWVWYMGKQGPSSHLKKLVVPAWKEIERNYVPKVAQALEDMIKIQDPDNGSGKIVLWHGEPGTGKTTALRALAREWKSWCSFHYIADPERFFESPSYLMEVGSTPSGPTVMDMLDDDEMVDRPTAKKQQWRLVVCEDSDEFLRADARSNAGAAMGRLLNFSDGILGQGSNTLILFTTNERLDKLHPAITRPGRCLSQVHFQSFTASEASAWLGPDGHATKAMTLAEMIEHRDQLNERVVVEIEPEAVGQYL